MSMFRPRIIPVLLLRGKGLVKSIKFAQHRYIGDPINAVRIFNDLKADELAFLDIEASPQKRHISPDFVKMVGEEANMPFAVGGGVNSLSEIQEIIAAGAEKVIINTSAMIDPKFIKAASETFGSSTITVCIDIKKKMFGKPRAWILSGARQTEYTPVEIAIRMEECGAGEIIIQSIDRDGTMLGYDIDLIKSVSNAVNIPVVALGGAGNLEHLKQGYFKGHASGLAAGSLFIYHGKRNAVLINYPRREELIEAFRTDDSTN